MAEKDDDKKHEGTHPDEDYGLPKVDITPIGEKPATVPATPLESSEETTPPLPAREVPLATKQDENTVQTPASKTEPAKLKTESEKKTDYSWLLWLLLLLLLGLGGWYYYVNNATQITPPPVVEEETMDEQPPIVEEVEEAPLPIEPEEEEEVTLTVVTSRVESPRYFLVVGSFIDEDMAMDYSKDLIQKGMRTYLVHPYGEIAYYRLAIGQFESFALAAVEMDRVQGDFKENLWVLKY